MDKVMKAKVEKILEELVFVKLEASDDMGNELIKSMINNTTSSLTSLIIKWLEGKKIDILDHHEKYHKDCHRCIEILACNQLITELIGEFR
jgi:hypothetical protein